MSARQEPSRLTYQDYCALPDDGLRRELIDGGFFVTPAPRLRHQTLVGRLYLALANHVETYGGGDVFVAPVDVVLSAYDVVQPDLLFVADEDRDRLTPANLQGAPTLAIEVLSDAHRDRRLKRQLYARAGVKEYWLVEGDGDWVEVYRLDGATYGTPEILGTGDLLRTHLLAGLEISLEHLFRE